PVPAGGRHVRRQDGVRRHRGADRVRAAARLCRRAGRAAPDEVVAQDGRNRKNLNPGGPAGPPLSRSLIHMARLSYADLSHPEAKPLVDRIVAERGSVLHLYQMLLHSPAVASGWLNYLTSIRQLSTLPGDLRELVIMRVA